MLSQNAIEEKVLERAAQKLRLDQLVIQQGRAQTAQKGKWNTAYKGIRIIDHCL